MLHSQLRCLVPHLVIILLRSYVMALLDCQRGTGKREFHSTEVLKRNLVMSPEIKQQCHATGRRGSWSQEVWL